MYFQDFAYEEKNKFDDEELKSTWKGMNAAGENEGDKLFKLKKMRMIIFATCQNGKKIVAMYKCTYILKFCKIRLSHSEYLVYF